MTVICLTITESEEQVVSGIPRSVCMSVNISGSIFYTLDGSEPTLYSPMYVSPVYLPFDQNIVCLKAFATNGTVSSAVIEERYQTNSVDGNVRRAFSGTDAHPGSNIPNSYPFGTPNFQPDQTFNSKAGITVDNVYKPACPNAFNADGYGTSYTNKPYNTLNYQIQYTTENAEGQMGRGIGNLPAEVIYKYPASPPEESNQFTNTFDPRALVIYQNFADEDPSDPPQINRQWFSLEDPNTVRDGAYLMQAGEDPLPPSGSFIRSYYNPRTGDLTSYYRDAWANRWIISTAPYQPNNNGNEDLTAMVVGKSTKVFEWIPFARRTLF
jgi:chitobiase/beta-hexosaminidase-like protein